ncbi:hypothetical protein QUB05_02525 [Microcoleus sp. F10-C6]|uniref:hypothetical protein n=1 Tax=unclassified Microcoleus TaxID=2642155 RepID=UPI002FCECCAF
MCNICAIGQKWQKKKQPNSGLLDTSQFSVFIDLKQLSSTPEFKSAKPLHIPQSSVKPLV